jgi:hypothetical protein
MLKNNNFSWRQFLKKPYIFVSAYRIILLPTIDYFRFQPATFAVRVNISSAFGKSFRMPV